MTNRKNTQDFIVEAKEIHGGKYDYSKVNYKNARTKVCLICPVHGEFWQAPFNHLQGHGCPKCAGVVGKTTKAFIENAKEIHGDKYDYSNVNYKNNKVPVCIICADHGAFWQKPNDHLMGHGCPKCGRKQSTSAKTSSTDEFIRKARQVHGDKYCYSNVKYVNSHTKVCIICEEHGEFWQSPNSHLRGRGCPQCARIKSGRAKRMTAEEFVSKAKNVHGDKYVYSEAKYTGSKVKICIICPRHGKFWQIPSDHLNGCGCKKCRADTLSASKKLNTEKWICYANRVHGGKYDYSVSCYSDSRTPIMIVCPKHGAFSQLPYIHLQGHGCPKCAIENKSNLKKLGRGRFISQAKSVHKDKYDYSKVKYVNNHTKVCIICPVHGEFWQTPNNHLNGRECPKCAHVESKPELEIARYISSLIGKESVILRDRKLLGGKELDIYVPNYRTAIEFDGLYWHNDTSKGKYYHLNKTEECGKRGISLIHIFEDEWNDKREIVLSMLNDIFNKNKIIIPLSQISLKEIGKNEAQAFFKCNYIKGITCSKYNYGIYCADKLEFAVAFRKINKNSFKLLGFCHKSNIKIENGEKMLLSYFVEKYAPYKLIACIDRRLPCLCHYKELGFHVYRITDPEYYYLINAKRIGKKEFGKRISASGRKYHKIYDCGQVCYEWKNNNVRWQ